MDFNLLWKEDATNTNEWLKFAEENQNHKISSDENLVSIIDILKNKNMKTILDIGCGVGLYSHFWIEKGFDYTGIDQIYFAIKIAKDKNPDGDFICGDFLNLNIVKNFDVVFTHTVLQHVHKNHKDVFLNKIVNVIKENSGFFLTWEEVVGDSPSVLNLTDPGTNTSLSQEHPYLYSMNAWIDKIENEGLKYLTNQENYLLFAKV